MPFTLCDITGQTVRAIAGDGHADLAVNRNGLASGVYFVIVEDVEGKRTVEKIVLQ